jgi:hypothetical protein
VKNHANPYTGGFEGFENAGKSQRETTRRPRQCRVLHQNPRSAPAFCPASKPARCATPPFLGPRDPLDGQFKIFRYQSFAKVPAILFDRVRGRVLPSEERDDALPAHFQ